MMSLLLRIINIMAKAFSLLLIFLVIVNSSSTTMSITMEEEQEDPYKVLHIIRNPNGTLTRSDIIPQSPPSSDPNLPTPALSKDLTINQSKHTWARIYLPHNHNHNHNHKPPAAGKLLPLIVFYHGGGFVFYSAASTYFHNFCSNLANNTQSVVVSVEYRLAPEHRLPAAYEDAVEALHWIKTSNDPWLTRHADYSRCYLMGESAGGNIAYNAGLRVAAAAELENNIDNNNIKMKIKPPTHSLNIKGMILIQPFFGGTKRTESEIRLGKDFNLPLLVTDSMWNLSLPVGADRDHPYSNPMVNIGDYANYNKMKLLGWTVAVFGCDGDQLVDRQRELAKLLQDKGVNVKGLFYGGGRHGIFVGDPSMSVKVFDLLNTL